MLENKYIPEIGMYANATAPLFSLGTHLGAGEVAPTAQLADGQL